jgi:TatD DNase family protein
MIKLIPLDRLLVSSDCPSAMIRGRYTAYDLLETQFEYLFRHEYCVSNPDHSNMLVKDRNEPVSIVNVIEAIAKLKNVPIKEIVEATWKNTLEALGLDQNLKRKIKVKVEKPKIP